MNPYIELLRPYNGILAVLGVIIGAVVGASISITITALILAIIVSFLINGAGNVINDYFDYNIDKINRPKRPIPSGRVKRKNVLAYFIALIIVSLVLSYFVSINFLYIAVINSIVSLIYSWKLKGAPLIGNIAVSWLAASTFLAGALITHDLYSLGTPVMILASLAFLATLSREIFKDIEDVKGDKTANIKTLPLVAGEAASRILASIVLTVGIISLLLPAYWNLFSVFYYVGMVPAVLICLAALRYMKNANKAQKMIKVSMYFVFLGFILGTLL